MSRAMAARPTPRLVAPSAKSAPSKSPGSTEADSGTGFSGYFHRTERPLTNLMFLLPLLAAYELGTRQFVQNPIIAFALLQRFFAFCRATGKFMPAMAVVGILLSSHLYRRDPWRVRISDLWKMGLESMVLSLPLLLLWIGAGPYLARLPLFATPGYATPLMLTGWAVPCIGAGIYEELIFRLIILNVLSLLLIDLLQFPKNWAIAGIIVSSALMFAAYHYLGSEKFSTVTFVFRTIAGLYFAAIFLCRGFGVTCGCHASYDFIVIGLRFLH
jgi:membrane protease YdiL (CAAX protease family)